MCVCVGGGGVTCRFQEMPMSHVTTNGSDLNECNLSNLLIKDMSSTINIRRSLDQNTWKAIS